MALKLSQLFRHYIGRVSNDQSSNSDCSSYIGSSMSDISFQGHFNETGRDGAGREARLDLSQTSETGNGRLERDWNQS